MGLFSQRQLIRSGLTIFGRRTGSNDNGIRDVPACGFQQRAEREDIDSEEFLIVFGAERTGKMYDVVRSDGMNQLVDIGGVGEVQAMEQSAVRRR